MVQRSISFVLTSLLLVSLPISALADGWLYGRDGLTGAGVYLTDSGKCRTHGGSTISCHMGPSSGGAEVYFRLFTSAHPNGRCTFWVKNGGTIFADRWDVHAMPTASSMQCRLQFLGKNSFNVYPPGK